MESARALIDLQQVDLDILRNRKALEAIPEMAEIQEVRAKAKELARRTTKIVGQLKDQRMFLEEFEEERARHSERAEVITLENETADFRRVRDNNAELDRIAKRIEKVDFNADKARNEISRLEALQAQSDQVREALATKERTLLATLKDKAQSIRDELTRLTGERESLIASIPDDLMQRYLASCKAHGMVGVARLEGGSCTGCCVALQPAQLARLRQGQDIATCPVCGRILVVRTQG